MKSKRSVAAQVIGQRGPPEAEVHQFAGVSVLRSEGDEPRLIVEIRDPNGIKSKIDVSCFLKTPHLEDFLLEAFVRRVAPLAKHSRYDCVSDLRRGFLAFLSERDLLDASLDQLDHRFFAEFVAWLNQPVRRTGKLRSHITRIKLLNAIILLSEQMMGSPRWGTLAKAIVTGAPRNRWPGADRRITPRPRLTREHLGKIISAAETEFRALQARRDLGEQLLRQGNAELASGSRDFRSLPVCLAAVAHVCPITISVDRIRDADRSLYWAYKKLGLENLSQYLYASSRDLVPVAVLLSVATAFNPYTVFGLRWAGVQSIDRLGHACIRLVGPKGRAAKDQAALLNASSADAVGVAAMLEWLEAMTARIRRAVPIHDRDKLFVFGPRRGTNGGEFVPSAILREGASTSAVAAWQAALDQFVEANGLENFNLAQIRPTVIDEVHHLTGDLQKAGDIGQHLRLDTTWRSYTSDGTRRRYRERLGEVFLVRDRWWSSGGVIDPRNCTLTPAMDRGAATPGFLCLDPFDSPRPGQAPGRLCSAYGECPSCPLAAAPANDFSAAALFQGLRRAIYGAQKSMSPRAWLDRWAPVLLDLEAMLAMLPAEIVENASRIKRDLPPVG